MDAMILPLLGDEATLEECVRRALARKLVPCAPITNRPQDRRRIAFFKPGRIPAGWAKFALVDKIFPASEPPPCAA